MVFGLGSKKKDVKTASKEGQQQVRKGTREIEKEIRKLDLEENKLKGELKKYAANNQMKAVKTLAKSLVQCREQKQRLIDSKSNLQSVGYGIKQMETQSRLAETYGNVSVAMSTVNKATNLQKTTQIMGDFARQTELTNLQEEMMTDALSAAFDNDEINEESDDVVNKILAEVGLESTENLQRAPIGNISRNGISEPSSSQNISVGDPEIDKLLGL